MSRLNLDGNRWRKTDSRRVWVAFGVLNDVDQSVRLSKSGGTVRYYHPVLYCGKIIGCM